jgi:hypothetical protein
MGMVYILRGSCIDERGRPLSWVAGAFTDPKVASTICRTLTHRVNDLIKRRSVMVDEFRRLDPEYPLHGKNEPHYVIIKTTLDTFKVETIYRNVKVEDLGQKCWFKQYKSDAWFEGCLETIAYQDNKIVYYCIGQREACCDCRIEAY